MIVSLRLVEIIFTGSSHGLYKGLPSMNIKTHSSESRGQEEAGLHDEPVSYLQVAPL